MSLLRPIQYTGALLEACVVSSGALVVARRCLGGHDLRGSVGIRDAGLGGGHAAGQEQAPRAAPAAACPGVSASLLFVCPVPRRLIAAALICSVFMLPVFGCLCPVLRPAARLKNAVPVADFQHGIRVRRETGDSAGGPELQRERYEADTKLIPKSGNGTETPARSAARQAVSPAASAASHWRKIKGPADTRNQAEPTTSAVGPDQGADHFRTGGDQRPAGQHHD